MFFVDEIHRLPRTLEETFYPAMEDRRLPITVGQGAGARVVTLELPPFTLDRRDHPRRTADDAAARPLRHSGAPGALLRRGARADRRVARRRSCRSRSSRTALARSPRAAAARRAWPTACSSACATTPRCAATAIVSAEAAHAALELLEVDERGLDRLDREILRAICAQVRRRPRRTLHAGGRGRGGARHDRGRLRALPAPAGLDQAHRARPDRHRRRIRAPRRRARRRQGASDSALF